MSFWNSKKVKKTRKIHRCEFCTRKIPIGSSCSSESGVYEGDFQSYYLCNRCNTYINSKEIDLEDGFSYGDFFDFIYESGKLDCPACGSYRRRDTEWSDNKLSCNIVCDKCDNEYTVDCSFETKDGD
jgi:transcription elongation factor Elf1